MVFSIIFSHFVLRIKSPDCDTVYQLEIKQGVSLDLLCILMPLEGKCAGLATASGIS